jgi:hypothetical protein
MNERVERVHSINEQFAHNTLLIRENKDSDLEGNRERSLTIKYQEQRKRESVSRHLEDKVRSIRLDKSIDSGTLTKKAERGEEELSRLILYEQ